MWRRVVASRTFHSAVPFDLKRLDSLYLKRNDSNADVKPEMFNCRKITSFRRRLIILISCGYSDLTWKGVANLLRLGRLGRLGRYVLNKSRIATISFLAFNTGKDRHVFRI